MKHGHHETGESARARDVETFCEVHGEALMKNEHSFFSNENDMIEFDV